MNARQDNPLNRQFCGFELLDTALIAVDQAGALRYVNPAAENLLALGCRELLRHQLHTLFVDSRRLLNGLKTAIGNNVSFTEHDLELDTCQQQHLHVLCTITPIEHPQCAALIELRPVEQHLRIANEERLLIQQQANRELIRNLAHEIKNPLAGIRGATQLLARSLNDPKYDEFTDIIISEVDRLRNLADTMLGSRQLPSYELVNIHEPLERVRSLIVNQTKSKINIIRDYDLSLPEVMADRDQLIQVMLNICANAVQAMTEHPDFFTEHRPELILRTRIQRLVTINGVLNRSTVRVDIEDNGPGVPEDILESVFYPLVTGRANGTGLGLSIAQNIMHQHNGMIECQSIPGKTVFSLYLPWEASHVAK